MLTEYASPPTWGHWQADENLYARKANPSSPYDGKTTARLWGLEKAFVFVCVTQEYAP